MFNKVLIANRGEIAVRVIRACHSLGISTVAIYADDDRTGQHVTLASEAYALNGSTLAETYLNIEHIIQIAQQSGAEAIHPGYGFLSENPEFADACAQNGVVFIGPKAEVMRKMSSKVEARGVMEQAGVPITPGSPPLNDLSEAQTWAQKIGFPVLLKASAGGGGRGMKKVLQSDALADAFASARREAQTYFGDGTVYMEKLVQNPRHIEVQILGDSHGNVVHLGERDCSIQRRNQKLVEEAPAPNFPEEVRQNVLQAAVKGAQALNYTGAGTFEFVVQNNQDVYFMEVNTRLQVEHPVTEMISQRDLVHEQLRIAAGESISFSQDELRLNGHAIEFRITIEDAKQNFRPIPGHIQKVSLPSGPWVRVDGMLQDDYTIPGSYDSLIAKLIVWGQDREIALGRMRQALSEFKIDGVSNLLNFFKWLMTQADFCAGDFNTGFLDAHFEPQLLAESGPLSDEETPAPTRQKLEMEVNGKRFEVALLLPEGFAGGASSSGGAKKSKRPQGKQGSGKSANPNQIISPMSGSVVQMAAEVGQNLEQGQMACVIESMKMENDIISERSGTVAKVHVQVGEQVQAGAVLVEFEA